MALLVSNSDMQEISIKYGGGSHIQANTYINCLLHFTNIIQEVNRKLSKDKKLEVRIKANKEGSFVVDLSVESMSMIDNINNMFTMENAHYSAGVISVAGEAYKVARHLKGKRPRRVINDKDVTVKVENEDGQMHEFDFRGASIYFNNPSIQEAISQQFETLESDTGVTGIGFLDGSGNVLFEAQREAFYELSSSVERMDTSNERVEVTTANLNISSLDWDFKKKWDFYYYGNKISAKVEDDVFAERINRGERFGKGDTLVAEMEIKQQYEESVNAFVNKNYTVTKILEHIERPAQGKLDL